MTVTIQIGNSDNKLSQSEWADYAHAIGLAINNNVPAVHFTGGSDWNAPWQNACWVCEATAEQTEALTIALSRIRKEFRQDSVAITPGVTSFV